ncbi:unnamed protein product, partial [Symbiodinium sp. CCMP2456]
TDPQDELAQFFGEVQTEPMGGGGEPATNGDGLLRATTTARHDEEIKILKQDHSIVMFLRPGENQMLSHLYNTAKLFKQKQQANPTWAPGQQPLKLVMAVAMFTKLGVRLEKTCSDEALAKKVQELGWRDPTVGWKFQYWNNNLRCLQEDTTRTPLTDQAIAQHLKKLVEVLGQPDVVHRFACTRRMSDTMESTATFLLDLTTRTPASLEAWHSLQALQGCTLLQLGGMAYKKESFKPSPAIQKLKEMIRGL